MMIGEPDTPSARFINRVRGKKRSGTQREQRHGSVVRKTGIDNDDGAEKADDHRHPDVPGHTLAEYRRGKDGEDEQFDEKNGDVLRQRQEFARSKKHRLARPGDIS